MELYHWAGVWSVTLLFGLFWLAYAIRSIVTDEEDAEKRRQRQRERELRRRAKMDQEAKKARHKLS